MDPFGIAEFDPVTTGDSQATKSTEDDLPYADDIDDGDIFGTGTVSSPTDQKITAISDQLEVKGTDLFSVDDVKSTTRDKRKSIDLFSDVERQLAENSDVILFGDLVDLSPNSGVDIKDSVDQKCDPGYKKSGSGIKLFETGNKQRESETNVFKPETNQLDSGVKLFDSNPKKIEPNPQPFESESKQLVTESQLFDLDPLDSQSDPHLFDQDPKQGVSDQLISSSLDLLHNVHDEQVLTESVTEGPPDLLDLCDNETDKLTEVSHSEHVTMTSEPEFLTEKELLPDFIDVEVHKANKELLLKDKEHTMEKAEEEHSEKEIEEIKTEAKVQKIDEFMDFSVLALPDSHLNFDLNKHKRALSQKGSIARRKKPSRATILAGNSEEARFNDSTAPRPPKPDVSDEDKEKSVEKFDNKVEHDIPDAPEPTSKKFMGGVKIPGLLEGLTKSKSFKRAGRKTSPDREKGADTKSASPASVPTTLNKDTPSVPLSPILTKPTPIARPRPVALPRVLPKLPQSKELKETQNQSLANVSVNGGKDKDTEKSSSVFLQELKNRRSSGLSASSRIFSKPEVKSPPAIESVVLKPVSSNRIFSKPEGTPPPQIESVVLKPANRDRPPPVLKPKPVGRVPPTISAKPVPPTKPKRTSLAEIAVVDPPLSGEPSEFPVKKPLPPLGSVNSPAASAENQSNTKEQLSENVESMFINATESSTSPTSLLSQLKTKDINLNKSAEAEQYNQESSFLNYETTDIPAAVDKLSQSHDEGQDLDSSMDSIKADIFRTVTPRKSSISHVEPPTEKVPRKISITGSAYAPMGFRSPSFSDNEPKSRASSVSSSEAFQEVISKNRMDSPSSFENVQEIPVMCRESSESSSETFHEVSSSPTSLPSESEQKTVTEMSSEDTQKSSSVFIQELKNRRSSGLSASSRIFSKPDVKSPRVTSNIEQRELSDSPNQKDIPEKSDIETEDKEKEDSNKKVENNVEVASTSVKLRSPTSSLSSTNGDRDETPEQKPMFGVQLRKVEKKSQDLAPSESKSESEESPWKHQMVNKRRSHIERPTYEINSSSQDKDEGNSPANWRQQLSNNKRRSFVPDTQRRPPSSVKEEEAGPAVWGKQLLKKRQSDEENDAGLIESDHK